MRILPILWGEAPTSEDWARLSEARKASGYTDLIKPAQGLPGSPQPVLAVGTRPSWITDYAFVEDTTDIEQLTEELKYCLEGPHGTTGEDIARVIGAWMGTDVTYKGEEEYDSAVAFE